MFFATPLFRSPVRALTVACVAVGLLGLTPCAHSAPPAFETISNAASPEVTYAFETATKALTLQLRVAAMETAYPQPAVHLGVANDARVFQLDEKNAAVIRDKNVWLYTFTIPASALGGDATKAAFRWALSIDWVNSAGASVQKQNYLVPSTWPPYRDIGNTPSAWAAFNFGDYQAARQSEALRITLTLDQPMDGKASVVIEDATGRRVRNLVTGQPFTTGRHTFQWDGLDEDGHLVTPGDYRWRAISHPGIRPEYLMHFYSPGEEPWGRHNWLADHSNPTSAAAYADHVVLGSPVAESGNNILLADLDGKKITGVSLSSFIGLGRVYLALGPDRIYALTEGSPHYDSVRKDADGTAYVYGDLSLVSWDYAGRQLRYMGKSGEQLVRTYRKPLNDPAVSSRTDKKRLLLNNLRGAVYLDGKLYLSLHDENRIAIIDPVTGAELGGITVEAPGPLATDGRGLYVLGANERRIFHIARPADSAAVRDAFQISLSAPLPYVKRNGDTWAVAMSLAVNAQGELFIADNGVDQNIKVYDSTGKLLREFGPRGGRAPSGAWQADAIRKPSGLALDTRGRLWLAEDEEAPKRVSVWDTNTGKPTREFFGPVPYGATGGGFDPRDATRWIGGGSTWKIDYQTKQAVLQSVLHHQTKAGQLVDILDGYNIRTVHQGDRTFLFAKGRYLKIFELLADGSARLWAVLGSLQGFEIEEPRWTVPEFFTRHPTLQAELAGFTQVIGPYGDLRTRDTVSKNAINYTLLWIDANGDQVPQIEELQVSGPAGPRLVMPTWGTVQPGLDLNLPLVNGKDWSRATLRLRGFLPSGAPDWNLADAYATAVPMKEFTPTEEIQSTLADNQGRLVLNTSPMTAIDADGRVRWQLSNDYAGVHGSQRAPLPVTGVMQGALGFLGSAPFDQEGDVAIINGNHGRYFAMTTDGIYLDEFFNDIRVALSTSAYNTGGENFGGYFARDEKSGRFLLQAGHGAFRIYEIKGLDHLVRSSGSFSVSAAQLSAAEKLNERSVARALTPKEAILRTTKVETVLAADPAAWPGGWTAEWGDASRPFPHARVKMLRQGTDLVIGYEVSDPSPWMNTGATRNLLFKTGDAVDFQFSTDPAARATRVDAAPGDRRLLIANFEGKPTAVLYDYCVPGTTDPVLFNSPWRSTKVDRVEVIAADIKVKKLPAGYTVTARFPLATLGLPATAGGPLRADFGVIYGDEAGTINLLRSYWANPATGLVNDVPGETQINPNLWGVLKLE